MFNWVRGDSSQVYDDRTKKEQAAVRSKRALRLSYETQKLFFTEPELYYRLPALEGKNVPSSFTQLGSGRSGAFVISTTDSASKQRIFMKFYMTTFTRFKLNKEDAATETNVYIQDDRPIREAYTLSMLTGIKGFPFVPTDRSGTPIKPAVYLISKEARKKLFRTLKEGVTAENAQRIDITSAKDAGIFPTEDTNMMGVSMSVAPGKPLMDINLCTDRVDKLGLLVELFATYDRFRTRLRNGRHWDLHPDNIFVDTEVEARTPIDFGDVTSIFSSNAASSWFSVLRNIFDWMMTIKGINNIKEAITRDLRVNIAKKLCCAIHYLWKSGIDNENLAALLASTMQYFNAWDVNVIDRMVAMVKNFGNDAGENNQNKFAAAFENSLQINIDAVQEAFGGTAKATQQLHFPTVTLIDFDLVTCDAIPTHTDAHREKLKQKLPLSERLLQWGTQNLSLNAVNVILYYVTKHLQTSYTEDDDGLWDMAHLFFYTVVIGSHYLMQERGVIQLRAVHLACTMCMSGFSGTKKATTAGALGALSTLTLSETTIDYSTIYGSAVMRDDRILSYIAMFYGSFLSASLVDHERAENLNIIRTNVATAMENLSVVEKRYVSTDDVLLTFRKETKELALEVVIPQGWQAASNSFYDAVKRFSLQAILPYLVVYLAKLSNMYDAPNLASVTTGAPMCARVYNVNPLDVSVSLKNKVWTMTIEANLVCTKITECTGTKNVSTPVLSMSPLGINAELNNRTLLELAKVSVARDQRSLQVQLLLFIDMTQRNTFDVIKPLLLKLLLPNASSATDNLLTHQFSEWPPVDTDPVYMVYKKFLKTPQKQIILPSQAAFLNATKVAAILLDFRVFDSAPTGIFSCISTLTDPTFTSGLDCMSFLQQPSTLDIQHKNDQMSMENGIANIMSCKILLQLEKKGNPQDIAAIVNQAGQLNIQVDDQARGFLTTVIRFIRKISKFNIHALGNVDGVYTRAARAFKMDNEPMVRDFLHKMQRGAMGADVASLVLGKLMYSTSDYWKKLFTNDAANTTDPGQLLWLFIEPYLSDVQKGANFQTFVNNSIGPIVSNFEVLINIARVLDVVDEKAINLRDEVQLMHNAFVAFTQSNTPIWENDKFARYIINTLIRTYYNINDSSRTTCALVTENTKYTSFVNSLANSMATSYYRETGSHEAQRADDDALGLPRRTNMDVGDEGNGMRGLYNDDDSGDDSDDDSEDDNDEFYDLPVNNNPPKENFMNVGATQYFNSRSL